MSIKIAGSLATCALVALTSAVASAGVVGTDVVATVPFAQGIVDLGHAPANGRVEIALTLNYRNEALLERLVELQADRNSPLFGHFLTNAQFNASFAPSSADYQRVATALRNGGFRVTQTYPNATVIDAEGTVAAANRFFATDIHAVRQPGYGIRYANATPAHEPAALRGLLTAVSGLHTLTINRTHLATMPPHSGGLSPDAAGPPLRGPVSSATGASGYGPLAFSQGYLFPEQFKSSAGKPYDGTGRASGVVIDADFLDSDLSAFLTYFKVTRTGPATVRVPIDGGPPSGDKSGDSLETTLDVESVVSNAPGTALYVYEFPSFNSDKYITDAYNKVASDNLVDTANSSFGGCETGQVADAKAWDKIALQGASKGITFHASSGDSGADVCGTGKDAVSAPASGPHFVAVGGTSLKVSSKGAWSSEVTWNSDGGATGGGVSKVFALPTWQKSVPGIITTGRNLPDVSLDADPNTGAAFYYGGSWNTEYDPLGGTSLASPLFGAALTEADQYSGARAGLEGKILYAQLASKGYVSSGGVTYFHDITSGCNKLGGAPGFCAVKGYDQATGIGSAVWYDLLTK
jgi:subtilase family serine protease